MAGRFTLRRAPAPDLPVVEEALPLAQQGVVLKSAPEALVEPTPSPDAGNPLLSDKLLDAKVRLHRRLIEEINLSALEKLREDEIRGHVQGLVLKYVLTERLALNAQE